MYVNKSFLRADILDIYDLFSFKEERKIINPSTVYEETYNHEFMIMIVDNDDLLN